MVVTTSYAYESSSLDAMKQWFSDMQKEIYVLGPLLPSGYRIETQKIEEGANLDVEVFLAEMQVQHGKQLFFLQVYPSSLPPSELKLTTTYFLQISFGTLFWPSVSEYIDELIEALIEKKALFVCDSCYNNI